MFKGFEPVFDKNSKVLILGSFPSVISRSQGFYYGNKQNRFWKMLSLCFQEEISESIESKKQFLLKHNIALYDIVTESNLLGSADSTLQKSQNKIANINNLLPPNTKVEKIICNGKTAYNLLVNNFNITAPVVCLPSTSGANPRYKFETWQIELEFLVNKT